MLGNDLKMGEEGSHEVLERGVAERKGSQDGRSRVSEDESGRR